ncbi:MAG: AraC family transcriptional regulator [Paracoccaceae bacterium]|nr:AraC family transcriptional regulator [Paracoccaceae bacterium]
MSLENLLADVREFVAETGMTDGFQACGVKWMGLLLSQSAKSNTSCSVIDPVIGLVLQGAKSARFGNHQVRYGAGDIIVIGQSLPIFSSVIDATPSQPYIAVYVGLDMQTLRDVFSDMGGGRSELTTTALETGKAEEEIVEAIARLFRLRRDPMEEQVLGEACLREVYFRVLRSRYSSALRQTILADSKANQIARAIAHIRQEYRSTIKAEHLASIAGMSASVFYETFKSVTANSPLQYQKDLRLLDAHQLLQQTNASVSEVAREVGYESAAQFSREFSRKFGAPPKTFAN